MGSYQSLPLLALLEKGFNCPVLLSTVIRSKILPDVPRLENDLLKLGEILCLVGMLWFMSLSFKQIHGAMDLWRFYCFQEILAP